MKTTTKKQKAPTIETATREQLVAEIHRVYQSLWLCDAIHAEKAIKYEAWTEDFFEAQGLEHLIESYHEYLSEREDEDEIAEE
jgi:hypothetical protein